MTTRPDTVPLTSPLGGHEGDSRLSSLRVALVCMPFASADRPSIQLGLMSAITSRAGHAVTSLQFNLDLAARLGPELYERLCERRSHMTGEWLFGPAAFGDDLPHSEEAYFERFADDFIWGAEHGLEVEGFSELRNVVLPDYIEACYASAEWDRFDVVGFSSLFQQNVASLALARRIKDRHPSIAIVMGGANMEGEMGAEYARAFPFLDYVVSGEADESFPALLAALSSGVRPLQLPGVIIRRADGVVDGSQSVPVRDLETLPAPDYGEYFTRAAELGLLDYYRPTWTLPYESSRGCWWGQKHHCTFCGLNGEGMAFRSKSDDKVLTDLAALAERHRICSFMMVDNILDVRYLRKMFPAIGASRLDYNFFYEVKSNLTHEQIRTLHQGGVRRVQPGIESLSTHVLQLMRKGCTMLQNIRCMKWCSYYGIGVNWNLIWGFPGETEEDYRQELEVLRLLTHLEPPIGSGRIWLERFSPHYTDPAFPIFQRRPEASYEYIYPAHVDRRKAAYFFDYEMGDVAPAEAHADTHEFVTQWREMWRTGSPPTLRFRRTANGMLIDRSDGATGHETYQVTGPAAALYEMCTDTMKSPARVAGELRALPEHKYDFEPAEVREALDAFCRKGLMVAEDDKYLGLALPLNPNW